MSNLFLKKYETIPRWMVPSKSAGLPGYIDSTKAPCNIVS